MFHQFSVQFEEKFDPRQKSATWLSTKMQLSGEGILLDVSAWGVKWVGGCDLRH